VPTNLVSAVLGANGRQKAQVYLMHSFSFQFLRIAGTIALAGAACDASDPPSGAELDSAVDSAEIDSAVDSAEIDSAEIDSAVDSAEIDSAEAAVESGERARVIVWTPCVEDAELQCGKFSVPMDYRHSSGEQIILATVRARALGHRRKGVVFVNPGGPGGSGVDAVLASKALFAELRENFDIVSFDPRGTGRSAPVGCEFEVPPQPSSDDLPAAAAFNDEVGRRIAGACLEQNGPLATLIGTTNVARDIDGFRAALGEPVINYLGYSYGTILGASYATLFPTRVRAMVLDGNTPPQWLGDYLVELDGEGSAGAELALRRIDQLCRADQRCPLRADGVVRVFDRVVARLDRSPVIDGDTVINGTVVREEVFSALYVEAAWPSIVQALALADTGDYSAIPPRQVQPSTTIVLPSTFAIACDDSRTRRLGLDYLPIQNAYNDLAPRFGGVNFGLAPSACSAWPRTEVKPVRNPTTAYPIVLIGNDFDPATPMSWSRNMASALQGRARLLRYQGGGHTIYLSGSSCIDNAINGYFRNLTAPARDLTCPALPLSFAPPSSARRAPRPPTMAEILPAVTPKRPQLSLPQRAGR
jgi:pimeloyl-ACP methyl ester carboxylesterase